MKKLFSAVILGFMVILLCTNEISARTYRHSQPDNFLTFSWIFKPVSLGYKHQLISNVYATGNLDYRSSNTDLEFQAGAAYLFPHKILIFRLYTGGGVQLSRNDGYQYPYVAVGTDFLFIFSEVIYPMESGKDPKYRAGFSLKF